MCLQVAAHFPGLLAVVGAIQIPGLHQAAGGEDTLILPTHIAQQHPVLLAGGLADPLLPVTASQDHGSLLALTHQIAVKGIEAVNGYLQLRRQTEIINGAGDQQHIRFKEHWLELFHGIFEDALHAVAVAGIAADTGLDLFKSGVKAKPTK